MKILMLSDVYFPRVNGVSTSIQTFRGELQRLGHEVWVIAPAYGLAAADENGISRTALRQQLSREGRLYARRWAAEGPTQALLAFYQDLQAGRADARTVQAASRL